MIYTNYLMFNKYVPKRKELLKGGRAQGMSPEDFDPKQMEIGQKIQMEHTDDPDVAKEISMDHLAEFDDYYDWLLKMEDELKKQKQYSESLIYLKNNNNSMKNMKTSFSLFVNENKVVTTEMRLNKDNKMKVVIRFDPDIIEQLESYNISNTSDKESGDWILYDSYDKSYSIVDNDDGEMIKDQNENQFFHLLNIPDSAYRIININIFHRMMDGL